MGRGRGSIYLSPLMDAGIGNAERRREILRNFRKVKTQSLLPVFLYLIQRL